MDDEGVIKFSCRWQPAPPMAAAALADLMTWRDRLFAAALIGLYPNGIGYGNISCRLSDRRFLVSGTQTGHLSRTQPCHYALVEDWDIEANWLRCSGPLQASSESLTHAALYSYDPAIQAVVHGHSPRLWRHYQNRLPTTRASVPYGTPAMAREMERLFRQEGLQDRRCLVMAGHEDGLLAFGSSLAQAATTLLTLAL
jgi:L-ribulose-5-phosphate 4-epimerase